jgi:hypothetical protein
MWRWSEYMICINTYSASRERMCWVFIMYSLSITHLRAHRILRHSAHRRCRGKFRPSSFLRPCLHAGLLSCFTLLKHHLLLAFVFFFLTSFCILWIFWNTTSCLRLSFFFSPVSVFSDYFKPINKPEWRPDEWMSFNSHLKKFSWCTRIGRIMPIWILVSGGEGFSIDQGSVSSGRRIFFQNSFGISFENYLGTTYHVPFCIVCGFLLRNPQTREFCLLCVQKKSTNKRIFPPLCTT